LKPEARRLDIGLLPRPDLAAAPDDPSRTGSGRIGANDYLIGSLYLPAAGIAHHPSELRSTFDGDGRSRIVDGELHRCARRAIDGCEGTGAWRTERRDSGDDE